MIREDEHQEFKKTTGELNEAMISVSAMLNKHKQGKVYFGLRNDGTPIRSLSQTPRFEMFPGKYTNP